MPTEAPEKILVDEREAARLIGFTPSFLAARRYRGDGPRYVRVSSRAVRYRPEDLRAWAAALPVHKSTSEER